MWKSALAVSVGGTIGCLLRWWFGMALNSLLPELPPGTVAVNFIGGFVIGAAYAFFGGLSAIAPEWRLFVITGFCGGLTTFSTFSGEIYLLMQQGRMAWAFGEVVVHVVGSVALTFLGAATVMWLRGSGSPG